MDAPKFKRRMERLLASPASLALTGKKS